MITPYSTIYKLNAGSSGRVLSKQPLITFPKVPLDKQKKQVLSQTYPQGIHIITKSNFYKVKGYDEGFTGWGSEDSAFQISVRTLCGPIYKLEGDALHFKHGIVKNRQYERDNGINGILLTKYKDALGDISKMKEILQDRRELK